MNVAFYCNWYRMEEKRGTVSKARKARQNIFEQKAQGKGETSKRKATLACSISHME